MSRLLNLDFLSTIFLETNDASDDYKGFRDTRPSQSSWNSSITFGGTTPLWALLRETEPTREEFCTVPEQCSYPVLMAKYFFRTEAPARQSFQTVLTPPARFMLRSGRAMSKPQPVSC